MKTITEIKLACFWPKRFDKMGNVASWSGSKTLSCFEYYDQAFARFCMDASARNYVNVNFATLRDTAMGPTIDVEPRPPQREFFLTFDGTYSSLRG